MHTSARMLVVDSRLLFVTRKLYETGTGCRLSVVGFLLLSVGRQYLSFALMVSDCCVPVVDGRLIIVGHRQRSWLSVAGSRLSVVEHRLTTVGVGFRLKFWFSVASSALNGLTDAACW
jgi:hypothetical protein